LVKLTKSVPKNLKLHINLAKNQSVPRFSAARRKFREKRGIPRRGVKIGVPRNTVAEVMYVHTERWRVARCSKDTWRCSYYTRPVWVECHCQTVGLATHPSCTATCTRSSPSTTYTNDYQLEISKKLSRGAPIIGR